jgi:hypothetical protein
MPSKIQPAARGNRNGGKWRWSLEQTLLPLQVLRGMGLRYLEFEELYSAGSSAVKGEQQGFSVAWKFISSIRVPSGS